jgi:hypothetical protein
METITHFFDKYIELSQGKDLNALAACYAEHFIAAGPKGIMAFSNDEKFMEWLKRVQEFNRQSGMQGMKSIKIVTTPVGEAYSMSTVTWSVEFPGKSEEPILFDISYSLFHQGGNYKIVLFISHEDQEALMKEKGVF